MSLYQSKAQWITHLVQGVPAALAVGINLVYRAGDDPRLTVLVCILAATAVTALLFRLRAWAIRPASILPHGPLRHPFTSASTSQASAGGTPTPTSSCGTSPP